MKIDPTGAVGPKAVRRKDKVKKAPSGNFAEAMIEKESAAKTVSGAVPVNPVESILAVQEVETDSEQRQARQRGRAILDHLDEIRHGLLMGAIPRHSLTNLAHLARIHREKISDPGLNEVLDEIELRAEVELAKLEQEA